MEKSRNLGLVGASTTEWQLITPRGGLTRPPPAWNRVKLQKKLPFLCLGTHLEKIQNPIYTKNEKVKYFLVAFFTLILYISGVFCRQTSAAVNAMRSCPIIEGKKVWPCSLSQSRLLGF